MLKFHYGKTLPKHRCCTKSNLFFTTDNLLWYFVAKKIESCSKERFFPATFGHTTIFDFLVIVVNKAFRALPGIVLHDYLIDKGKWENVPSTCISRWPKLAESMMDNSKINAVVVYFPAVLHSDVVPVCLSIRGQANIP